jgi:hypothetical protein
MIGGREGRVGDEPRHHRGRREERHALPGREQRAHLGRLEMAARRNDADRSLGDMRQAIAAGAVRQRRGVQHGIGRHDRIDIGEVAQRAHQQVAVREAGALGPARRAAGVEDPGEVVGAAGNEVDAVACRKPPPGRVVGNDHLLEAWAALRQRRHRRGELGADEDGTGRRMRQHVLEFLLVQPRVDRHRDEPAVPDAEQRFKIGGVVGRDDGDALARLEPQAMTQKAGDRPDAARPLPVREIGVGPDRDARPIGHQAGVSLDPDGHVHGTALGAGARAREGRRRPTMKSRRCTQCPQARKLPIGQC